LKNGVPKNYGGSCTYLIRDLSRAVNLYFAAGLAAPRVVIDRIERCASFATKSWACHCYRSSSADPSPRWAPGSRPELPNYPRRNEPHPNIPPLALDLKGDRVRKGSLQLADMAQDLRDMIHKTDPGAASGSTWKRRPGRTFACFFPTASRDGGA
jgi:hypothetical protein